MSEKTMKFEIKFSDYLGCKESVMVNSGSSADLLIVFALVNPEMELLKPGDEILVPSLTWPTQIWSAMMAGLKVKFIDTDPVTLNISLDDLKNKITNQTKALSLVHIMGNPCNMDVILDICKEHQLLLIEDCCESLGGTFNGQQVGTFGLASSFSFFFSHHITTMEGGMISCQDEKLSDMFRLLRAHGWARNLKYLKIDEHNGIDPRYMFLNWGFNVRPTELQAGFGLEQIKRLPYFNEQRKKNAMRFMKYLDPYKKFMRMMEVHPKANCSWFALPMILTQECPFQKNEFLSYLEHEGIETRPIVAGNILRQPAFQNFPEIQYSDLPGTDLIHDRGFYFGLHPYDSAQMLDRLAETMDRFIRRYH
jgi:CDP-6-deoxy-D-xylo-4-hexulose-3-dehydrase